MFDDASFYNRLAESSASYGKAKCADSPMYIAISALDFDAKMMLCIGYLFFKYCIPTHPLPSFAGCPAILC